MPFDRIAMICDETEEEKPIIKEEAEQDYFFGSSSDFMEQADPFKDYPWDGKPARYTDLENWLCGRGITSHRKIASIFDDSLKIGYIIKDAKTKLYSHYKSYNPSLRPSPSLYSIYRQGVEGNRHRPRAYTREIDFTQRLYLNIMARIDDYTIRRIKETAKIYDVVSDFIQLRKSGVRYTGLCPFHQDRHGQLRGVPQEERVRVRL